MGRRSCGEYREAVLQILSGGSAASWLLRRPLNPREKNPSLMSRTSLLRGLYSSALISRGAPDAPCLSRRRTHGVDYGAVEHPEEHGRAHHGSASPRAPARPSAIRLSFRRPGSSALSLPPGTPNQDSRRERPRTSSSSRISATTASRSSREAAAPLSTTTVPTIHRNRMPVSS